MANRDYHAVFPRGWIRGGAGTPSAQETFLASNYSLVIIGAETGTTRVQDLRDAATLASVPIPEMAWYSKCIGLHNPGAGAENETSFGYANMVAAGALARTSYPSGSIVTNVFNGWTLIDVIDEGGSGHQSAWITNQSDLYTSMFARVDIEGIYLDNTSVMIVTGGNSYVTPGAPGGYTDAGWYNACKDVFDGVRAAHAGKTAWFNSYAGFASAGRRGLSILENATGMFMEGFACKIDGTGTPGFWSRSRFKQQVDDCVTALASYGGKKVVVIDDINSDDIQRRLFILGGYLLAFNNTARLKQMVRAIDTSSDLDYCRELDAALAQLGAPSAAYVDDGTFLTREFTGGKVIVNPSDSSHTYTLPAGAWEQLDVAGTTTLGANVAFWSGSSSSINMPAHSALVIRQIGGETRYSITVDGIERFYTVYLPDPLPDGKIPAVIALHPGGTNSNFMRTISGMNTIADANGFAVVYPDGTPDGEGYWNAYGGGSEINDVKFIGDMISELPTRMELDAASVFICGFSNGGKMAHRYAAQRPNRVAACVGVAGGITTLDATGDPVPILHIHGDADPTVPYTGGEGVPPGDYPNLDIEVDVMPYWAARNGGTLTPVLTTPAYGEKRDYTDAGTTTWLYTITGGVHEWDFGGTPALDANLPGGSTEAAIWAFLTGRYLAPEAVLTATPNGGSAPLAVTLSGAGSSAPDGVLEYAFDPGTGVFGAWQVSDSSSVNFLTAGVKTVRLKVRDWAERESAIVSANVTVTAAVPAVTLTPTPSSGVAPLGVTLTAVASGGAGAPFTYSFDPGTGVFGAYGGSATANVTFLTTGTKTVRVKAKDSAGTESAITTAYVYVETAPAPTLTFTANKYTVKKGGLVRLTWTSTNALLVTASGDWRGNLPLSRSSWPFWAWRTSHLVLTAKGGDGTTVTASVRITVTDRVAEDEYLR